MALRYSSSLLSSSRCLSRSITSYRTSYGMKNYVPYIRSNVQNAFHYVPRRSFAEVNVKVPNLGDSVTEGNIATWSIKQGEFANKDSLVVSLETEKVGHEITAPDSGLITKTFGEEGQVVKPGDTLFTIDTDQKGDQKPSKKEEKKSEPSPQKSSSSPPPPPPPTPSPPRSSSSSAPPPPPPPQAPPKPVEAPQTKTHGTRDVERVPMSRMRKTIASNMKQSQNTLAMLTTFQECDMSELSKLREKYKDSFQKQHGIKLGFMSAFVKASAIALEEIPAVNAVIQDQDVIYHKYVDISVAVATPKGLVTPVLRNCEQLSFADIEQYIGYYGGKARENKITMEELKGGTFTISNGGVFGSMMGTPIVNPGQSAILGLHAIKDRAVVVDGQIVIRPIMFLALTYDHRLIDGREAVTFLKRVKELVEDPSTMLLA